MPIVPIVAHRMQSLSMIYYLPFMRKLIHPFIFMLSVTLLVACSPKESYKLDIQVDKSQVRGLEIYLDLSRDSIQLKSGEILVYELYFKNKMTDTLFLPENRFVMLYRQHQKYIKMGDEIVRVSRMDKPMFSLDTVYYNGDF